MNAQDASWDVVIAGAGLAGLSLAVELSSSEFAHLRVLLIEPRLEYVRDRTWSHWATPNVLPKRWASLAGHRWQHWAVSVDHRRLVSRGDVAYASVRADAFYEAALKIIAQAPNIHWLRGTSVAHFNSVAQGVQLNTESGESLFCQRLFDSRPPKSAADTDWVQHFKGWEIQSSKPCFEPTCVDLMAFERRPNGLHFLYCLPYSSTQALVESTWISRASVQSSVDADAELQDALAKRWGCTEYNITFREQGALPLQPRAPEAQPRVVRIGRAGGMLRAATGYAFCATLHQTADLAASLSQHLKSGMALENWRAPVIEKNAVDAWMDQVLFRVLESDWQAAPDHFMALFEHVSERQLIAFLQNSATWLDRFAVMKVLPIWPFMRAALG